MDHLADVIEPSPSVGPHGRVFVNRDTAQETADTLRKVSDKIKNLDNPH